MSNILEKAKKAFGNTTNNKVYGRAVEKERINDFLNSNRQILHITGKPGTGKTCTVKYMLKDIKYKYINYYYEKHIGKSLQNCKKMIVIIDEFDKYFEEKKAECLKQMAKLRQNGNKLITISNNLKMGDIKFLPYKSGEIEAILKEKINNEVCEAIIDPKTLTYISKKHEKGGDLRLVCKYIFNLLNNRPENEEFQVIRIADVFEKQETVQNNSVHRDIIAQITHMIADGKYETKDPYALYLKECETFNIQPLDRKDYMMLLEMDTP